MTGRPLLSGAGRPGRLPLKTKWLYGSADLGIGLLQATIGFYLMYFYTDIAKIDPATAGTAMLVSKFTWDAIVDPLFGWLSDRTRSRWGRRRPYMIFGALPLGLAAWLLFSIPSRLTGLSAFLIVAGTFLLFDTIRSSVIMPYNAWSAELTVDYGERTSLIAIRQIMSVSGYVVGATVIIVLVAFIRRTMGLSEPAAWSRTAFILGAIVAAAVWPTAFGVRSKPAVNAAPSKMPARAAYRHAFRNKPFMIYMIVNMLAAFVLTVTQGMIPYYVIYQLGMKGSLSIIMLVFLVTVVLFVYPYKILADRLNKGPAWAIGLTISGLALFLTFFLPHHPTFWIYPLMVLSGLGFAAEFVFPGSMIPDMIELDELITGERHEGIYYGLRSFLDKLTAALGSAVMGWVLAGFGYIGGAEQTAHALFGIRLLFCVIPAVILWACLPFLVRFPVTRKSHQALIEKLRIKQGL